MHYCPECKYEYQYHVTVCPDCGALLVDGLPPAKDAKPSLDDADATLLVESEDSLRIQFLFDLLDQEGVPYLIKGRPWPGAEIGSFSGSGVPGGMYAVNLRRGLTRVYVAAADKKRAKELWDSLQGSELTEDMETDTKGEE